MAVNQARLITITSVKGGTGKSTTVLNLAGIYSMMGKKVLIIDMDFYTGAIAASLKISNDKDIYLMADDLNNNRFDQLEDYVIPYNEQIDVIPAPKDPRYASKVSSRYVKIILAKAVMKYDVVLIDTNHLLHEINLLTMDMSDQIVYIMTNDPMVLKNMTTMIAIFKDMDKDNYCLVLNEATDHSKNYFNRYDIKTIIKDNIDYTIPNSFYLRNIDRFVLDGKIATLDKKVRATHKKAIENLELLARFLLKEKKK